MSLAVLILTLLAGFLVCIGRRRERNAVRADNYVANSNAAGTTGYGQRRTGFRRFLPGRKYVSTILSFVICVFPIKEPFCFLLSKRLRHTRLACFASILSLFRIPLADVVLKYRTFDMTAVTFLVTCMTLTTDTHLSLILPVRRNTLLVTMHAYSSILLR